MHWRGEFAVFCANFLVYSWRISVDFKEHCMWFSYTTVTMKFLMNKVLLNGGNLRVFSLVFIFIRG